MRFVLDILDIKNILGMQRTQPQPAYDPDLLVLRCTTATAQNVTLYFTGAITIYYTYNGVEHQDVRLASDWSGVYMSLNAADAETDIKIRGNITQAGLDYPGNTIHMLAISNTVTVCAIRNNVLTLDLRNADLIQGFGYNPYGIETLYAVASTTDQRNLCTHVLTESPTGGTMFIDDTDTYAAAVKTVAQAQGWNVYSL